MLKIKIVQHYEMASVHIAVHNNSILNTGY